MNTPAGGALRAGMLALATLPMLCLWAWPGSLPSVGGGLAPAPWHALLELAPLLACSAIAAIAWNSRALEVPASVQVLGCACAGALLLDLARMLAFAGPPELIGTNLHVRSITLSAASGLLIALGLVAAAALPEGSGRDARWVRGAPVAVAACALLVLGVAFGAVDGSGVAGSADPAIPLLLSAGKGVLVGLFLLAGALLFRSLGRPLRFDAAWLVWAAALLAMAEAVSILSTARSDAALVVGQLYKVAGFWMVWRAVVTDCIRAPHQRLADSRRRLRESEAALRSVTDNIPAMVAFVDRDLRFRFVNRNHERWLGLKAETMLGRTPSEVFGAAHDTRLQTHLERALAGQTVSVEHRITGIEQARGRWLNITYMPKVDADADGQVSGVYIVSSDITEVMVAERRARFLAEHDELTTLPNRVAFRRALVSTLDESSRESHQFAVIIVDVDRFKVVNDTLGHATGDQLLQTLAERMRQVVRGQDVVARMGGDEMCLLLKNVRDSAHATEITDRVLAALRVPFELRSGVPHHMTVSAGIAMFPQDGCDPETLLRHADMAMYRTKAAGRDGFSLFCSQDNAPAEARLALELELRNAIAAGQLVLHYQPRVDIVSGQPVGMEALVRWQHPERGLLSPGHFIDIAEETGLIVPMGAWVLLESGHAMRRLQASGIQGLVMSVNVSARQFKNPRLVDEVAGMIEIAGCAPHQIELELTESVVMHQPEMAEATMRRLKALGVRLAMDDFGTGYSSLGALKRFPVDCVKIDRSFVNDIPTDQDDSALTRAIIAMGHSLGLHVVAEGVERSDQLEFLRREGCDEYQGYFFAKPLTEAALTTLLIDTSHDALVA